MAKQFHVFHVQWFHYFFDSQAHHWVLTAGNSLTIVPRFPSCFPWLLSSGRTALPTPAVVLEVGPQRAPAVSCAWSPRSRISGRGHASCTCGRPVTVPRVSIMVPAPAIVLAVVHRATVMFPTPEAPVVIQNSGWG
ncbi:hypothetical protein BD779DRAFT_1471818 [Infundibulicybe gibba]|nr:hypothetical protein BD779DRAFT_1471818 [Infundibulicybe gibba]